jgi:hypothetical protein
VHDSGVVADNQRFTSLPHHEREIPMALYELRTYTLHVGKMAEAVKLYQEIRQHILTARSGSLVQTVTSAGNS